jgi:hypothetical protein
MIILIFRQRASLISLQHGMPRAAATEQKSLAALQKEKKEIDDYKALVELIEAKVASSAVFLVEDLTLSRLQNVNTPLKSSN